MKRLLILLSLTIFLIGVLAADDSDHQLQSFLDGQDPELRLRISHIHGAGFDGEDLIIASHLGLIRYHDGQWVPENSPPHDFMGFSLVESGAYISGHPSLMHLEGLKNPLGIMFTSDLGTTLQPKGYNGDIDFHWLTAGYSSSSVYALTSSAPATGRPLFVASGDGGRTWSDKYLSGTTGSMIDIAAHPTIQNRIFLLTSDGVFQSNDFGGNFRIVIPIRGMSTVAVSRNGETIYVAGTRFLKLISNWRQMKELSLPEARNDSSILEIAVGPDGSGLLAYVAESRNIFLSSDDGETWMKILTEGDATL